MTRGCVAATIGGPPGICSALWQRPALVCRIAGWPLTTTRAAGVSHCTFTHGCGLPGGTVKAQPAIGKVSPIVATGWPLTRTRVLVGIVVTWPPCGQVALAPTWNSAPGIPALLVRVRGAHVTTSAPPLTVTEGPDIRIVAPLPFVIVMPVSLTMISAPVGLLRRIPPVGPGTSLIIRTCCAVVCRTTCPNPGGAPEASTGT